MIPNVVYHLISRELWEVARNSTHYTPPTFGAEGFIHLSLPHQTLPVYNRYFKNQRDVFLLTIDTSKLESRLVMEGPVRPPGFEKTQADVGRSVENPDLYPHLYGPLNLSAVTEVVQLTKISL